MNLYISQGVKVDQKNFELLKVLGQGSFGRVSILRFIVSIITYVYFLAVIKYNKTAL